jgi:hypothetical protein
VFHAADAIPGGSAASPHTSRGSRDIPVNQLLDIELPPSSVVDFLLDTYLTSVHWFMPVFDEPSLRIDAHRMISTGMISEQRKIFPFLLLVILAYSARYASPEDVQQACPGYDLTRMELLWIKTSEANLLDALEDGGIEAIQTALVMKSYYLYGNRHKRSFAVLGAAIKIALASKLHLESTWNLTDQPQREMRRLLWWSLWIADVWAAVIYGTPCNIHVDDWDVAVPMSGADYPQHPGFNSPEIYNGVHYGPATTFTYQRYKCWLYRIAFSIINEVYTHQKVTLADTIGRIRDLDEQLSRFEAQIPPELLLRNVASTPCSTREALGTFQRQALVLQLSLDNFRLLLHRPLLTMNRIQRPPQQHEMALVDEMIKTSKYRCWDAAMRTTQVSRHPHALRNMRQSLGGSYIMMQSFTAAVVLSIFALSDPASKQAFEAKASISRTLNLPKSFRHTSNIFDQFTAVLEELIRLILNEEMRSLVSHESQPLAPMGPSPHEDSSIAQYAHRSIAEPTSIAPAPDDISYGNFSDALVSLQDAFRENRTGTEGVPQPTSAMDLNYASSTSRQDAWPGVNGLTFGTDSQSWIWDEFWQLQDPPYSQFEP